MENDLNLKVQTQITLDEDVSLEKLKFLIDLGIEEERLDYKESLDLSEKNKKKAKIDLVCDLIAMSNTDGGYVIIGVKELSPKGKYQLESVSKDCLNQITQEKMIEFMANYVDAKVKLIIKSHVIEEKDIILIYVSKSKILTPFKLDGQSGNNEIKFRSGDIYVRHGATSTKAKHEDLIKFIESIRLDERRKLSNETKGTVQIINRLDKLLEVFTGSSPSYSDFDILVNTNEAIEDYVFYQSNKNDIALKRLISKYFKKLRADIKTLENIDDPNTINERLSLGIPTSLEKIIPIWNALNETKNENISLKIADEIYDLWLFVFEINDQFLNPKNKLTIHSLIIQLVYLLISISIKNNNPQLSLLLIKRKAENSEYGIHRNSYWFRYVLTWLSRTDRLKIASLIQLSFDNYKENEYVKSIFEQNEQLFKYLTQADFLQCLNSMIDKDIKDKDCWPSFRLHKKIHVIPIIEDIIKNGNNKWIDKVENKVLSDCLIYFDEYTAGGIRFNWSWDFGYASSKTISEIIKPN